eukprot:1179297-Prorocentrum_minimum.AAC.5
MEVIVTCICLHYDCGVGNSNSKYAKKDENARNGSWVAGFNGTLNVERSLQTGSSTTRDPGWNSPPNMTNTSLLYSSVYVVIYSFNNETPVTGRESHNR